jgi:hypothetical protein
VVHLEMTRRETRLRVVQPPQSLTLLAEDISITSGVEQTFRECRYKVRGGSGR